MHSQKFAAPSRREGPKCCLHSSRYVPKVRNVCVKASDQHQPLLFPSRRSVVLGFFCGFVFETSASQSFAEDNATSTSSVDKQAAPVNSTSLPESKPSFKSSSITTPLPKDDAALTEEAAQRLLQEEEERRKLRRTKKGRIREIEEIRIQLAEKELILLEKEKELLAKDQTLDVLKEQLELERKLRALLTKEKEQAQEEAALAMGLCTGGAMLP